MDYIVLNGINSTTIPGLMIQALPPISKPLIRTQVDEIDGRDGDIVTKLGYSAYDKDVVIGLYGNYNIDNVIAFFNSSGTVIFSSEPTKYYKYEILSQIDFEKLIRYRTATVTFHVQPFKYSAGEKTFVYTNQLMTITEGIKTVNGVTVSVNNGFMQCVGTATEITNIMFKIDPFVLPAGSYVFRGFASGLNPDKVTLGFVYNSSSVSFGNITLANNEVVSISEVKSQSQIYNNLYLHFEPGKVDFNFVLQLAEAENLGFDIYNNGNYYSKPKIEISGAGTVNLSLNNKQIFVINLSNDGYITIDADKMNAYNGAMLKNRSVLGDYGLFNLIPGRNTISYTGMVTGVKIKDYSRWI